MKRRSKLDILLIISFFIAFAVAIYSILIEEIHVIVTYMAIFLTGVCLTLSYNRYIKNNTEEKLVWLEKRLGLWNTISYRVKVAGETTFNDMPIGIIVYNNEYGVEWANNYAKEIFLSTLVERNLKYINNELVERMQVVQSFDIVLYGKEYQCSVLKDDNILFFTDKTDFRELEKRYNDRILVGGIINLDNLDQALATVDPQERSMILSNLIGIISEWCSKYQVYVRGYSEEQYIIIMDRKTLQNVLRNEFEILDEIKNYCEKENLRITASIGVCSEDMNICDLMDTAKMQLSLAINRGGNQAVVLLDGETRYYGGKSSGIENRSPVYVRVKCEDFRDLILHSNNIYVTSHTDIDTDGIGAMLSIIHFVKALGKECWAILTKEQCDQTVKLIYDHLEAEHVNIIEDFVSPSKAVRDITEDDLVVVVDTQYVDHIPDARLLKRSKKIAIIDHHRRSSSAIKDYVFIYNQSSASSTVELIIEMYEYLNADVAISPIEATIMLLGIVVDTSNLMYRTSYRTFNVMAKLQSYGAEMSTVKKFLREDFGEYVEKMAILNSMELVDAKYAIAMCSEEKIYPRQFIAKVTDSMISVSGVKAAFCIGRINDNRVGISARSLDEENVQVIMERLNGGGHFNNAATQISNCTIDEAKEQLMKQLEKVENGGEDNMKIILIKDVKGKGKEGEVIDIPSGHANYLIRNKSAVLATIDNMKQLEKKANESKQEAEKHLEDMKKLAQFIEANPITVAVRVGKEGKLFGAVSTKHIVDEYKNKYDIALDKRKIKMNDQIDAVGTYSIVIELHKEVKAKITLYVVEKA